MNLALTPMSPIQFASAYLMREFTSADRTASLSRLDASRFNMAVKILQGFAAAGYPTRVGMAAVTNAFAESRLNPTLVATEPRGGVSVGLFQLYDRGAGADMTIAQRQNPDTNIRRIIDVEAHTLAEVVEQSDTPAQAAWAFCYYVERPDNASTKANIRQSMARAMWPDLADAFPDEVPEIVV